MGTNCLSAVFFYLMVTETLVSGPCSIASLEVSPGVGGKASSPLVSSMAEAPLMDLDAGGDGIDDYDPKLGGTVDPSFAKAYKYQDFIDLKYGVFKDDAFSDKYSDSESLEIGLLPR